MFIKQVLGGLHLGSAVAAVAKSIDNKILGRSKGGKSTVLMGFCTIRISCYNSQIVLPSSWLYSSSQGTDPDGLPLETNKSSRCSKRSGGFCEFLKAALRCPESWGSSMSNDDVENSEQEIKQRANRSKFNLHNWKSTI